MYDAAKYAFHTLLLSVLRKGVGCHAITTDGWTSRAGDSYVSVTCHVLAEHSPPPWAAPVTLADGKPVPRDMGPGPSSSERRNRFAEGHTRCVTHKSPPPHFIIYTYMAETLLLTAGDDGEGEDRTPKHVHAVAWVDTTHSITNAAALSTTEDVETTRASGSPSNYTGIVGELLAAFLELRDRLNIQATISSVPAHAGIDGNKWAHSEARAAIRQMASTPSAFRNSVGDAAGRNYQTSKANNPTARHLRMEREERPDEQLRPVPLMPNDIPRTNQTLVRRLVTNTVLSPALRHKFFSDDPDEGKCRRCRRTAAAAHHQS
ncbi:hypothetical protein HPB47_027127 [Ixodes persulcatus]|uniref:Uncharacterized protein n=1 Tax=Ixodes persulcatus TaxID=34615 RepID=A0AC60PYG9_IXOPE|nr:hypothetical protein HPB47_027127 [Ixodes persulcatus]